MYRFGRVENFVQMICWLGTVFGGLILDTGENESSYQTYKLNPMLLAVLKWLKGVGECIWGSCLFI